MNALLCGKVAMLLTLVFSTNLLAEHKFSVSSQQIAPQGRLQAIAIEKNSIWVSGTESNIYHSNNGGDSWQKITAPKTEQPLQYRDIEVSANQVWLLSAGEGSDSRIYYSNNSGESWKLELQGTTQNHFYNCISLSENGELWLYGDSVDGELFIEKRTVDAKWLPQKAPFKAQPKEGGFAASGSCVINHNNKPLIATGNNQQPRFIQPENNWHMFNSPIEGGKAAGTFAMVTGKNTLWVAGGSLLKKEQPAQVWQYQMGNWMAHLQNALQGAVYGLGYKPPFIFAMNPQGIIGKHQNTNKWQLLSPSNSWAMACMESVNTCFAVGEAGTVTAISWE